MMADSMDTCNFLLIFSTMNALTFSSIAFMTDIWLLNLLNGNVYLLHNILYLLYFMLGILYSAIYPAANGLLLNWIDEEYRGRISTIWAGSLNIGGIFFYQLSYQLQTLKIDWRYNYYLCTTSMIVLAIITKLVLEPYPEKLGIHIQTAEYDFDDYTDDKKPDN